MPGTSSTATQTPIVVAPIVVAPVEVATDLTNDCTGQNCGSKVASSIYYGGGPGIWSYTNNTSADKVINIGISGLHNNDVFVVISNTTDKTVTLADGVGTGTRNKKSASTNENDMHYLYHVSHLNEQIILINRASESNKKSILSATPTTPYTPVEYKVGDSKTWKNSTGDVNNPLTFTATVKAKSSLSNGGNVYIWIDSSYQDINQSLINDMIAKFATNTNNIFDTETKLIGDFWGNHDSAATHLISDQDKDIHIIFSDILVAGASGVFTPSDSFNPQNGFFQSNQAHTLFLKATNLNDEKINTSSYQYTNTIMTVAHELQHMINFYQRNIAMGISDSNAIPNEMASVMMEDIAQSRLDISTKFQSMRFNQSLLSNNCSILKQWFTSTPDEDSCTLADSYNLHNAFGSYLIRKHSQDILKRLVLSKKKDMDALDDAIASSNARSTVKDEVNKFKVSYFVAMPVDNYGFPEYNNNYVNFSQINPVYYFNNMSTPYPLTFNLLPNQLKSFASATLYNGAKTNGTFTQKITVPAGVTVTAIVN